MTKPRDDPTDWAALLRITERDGPPIYEGEVGPGHQIELPNGLRVEVLWIRKHATSAPKP